MYNKIIHQIWMQGEENIPKKFRPNINSIKNINTDFKYILWDEVKLIQLLKKLSKTYPQYLQTYYKFVFLHQKIDFMKCVILHEFGGIYIDIDAESMKPLNTLLETYPNYDTIVSYTNTNTFESYVLCGHSTCYNNGIIIAKKGSEIMSELLNAMVFNSECTYYPTKYMTQFNCVNNTTGPNIFTNTIKNFISNPDNESKLLVLDNEYLEPCRHDVCNFTDNTYIVHRHEDVTNSTICECSR